MCAFINHGPPELFSKARSGVSDFGIKQMTMANERGRSGEFVGKTFARQRVLKKPF